MSDTITALKEFIDAAKRSRKYPENTAAALKTALRLFEAELNDEEKGSVEHFKGNLDRVYRDVFERNKTKYSSGSLDTYRKRVSKLINDYLAYGQDPAKMNNWSPPVRKPSISVSRPKVSPKQIDEVSPAQEEDGLVIGPGARIDWPLSEGRKAILILPPDLTAQEAETIKSLVALRVGGGSGGETGQSSAA